MVPAPAAPSTTATHSFTSSAFRFSLFRRRHRPTATLSRGLAQSGQRRRSCLMASERPGMSRQIQRAPQLQPQRRISLPCLESFKSSQGEHVKDGAHGDSKKFGDTGVTRGRLSLSDSSKVTCSPMASSTSPTVSPPSSSSRSRSSSPASFWSECEEDECESGRSRTPSPCPSEDGSYVIYQYSVMKVFSADF